MIFLPSLLSASQSSGSATRKPRFNNEQIKAMSRAIIQQYGKTVASFPAGNARKLTRHVHKFADTHSRVLVKKGKMESGYL